MKVGFHLIVNKNGSVRALKSKPNLHWDEISMEVSLEIPNAVFMRPQFKADLIVPETSIQAVEIPVELTDNIQSAIQQSTGYEVKLSLIASDQNQQS